MQGGEERLEQRLGEGEREQQLAAAGRRGERKRRDGTERRRDWGLGAGWSARGCRSAAERIVARLCHDRVAARVGLDHQVRAMSRDAALALLGQRPSPTSKRQFGA